MTKEEIREYNKKWKKENKEKVKEYNREYGRKWRKENYNDVYVKGKHIQVKVLFGDINN